MGIKRASFFIVFLSTLVFLACLNRGFQNESDEIFSKKRAAMVRSDIAARGIRDPAVLRAMAVVPRHLFVPDNLKDQAYEDHPLPIGGGQTISQPYIVAFMTESLALKKGEKVLEIGTGSGYQAAILALVTGVVFSIEIDPELAERAERTLSALKIGGVRIKSGDGFFGWPEQAPFDAVIVTCASKIFPQTLFDQLREGGRAIIPLETGAGYQTLTLIRKKNGKSVCRGLLDVRFVPMTGKVRDTKHTPE